MSAARTEVPEQAGYFGTTDRPLFGWLHGGSSGPLSGIGIVFCKPLGYEAVSAHRTVRAAALSAASRGAATLRFDYDGTGDSAGDDLDPARVTAWLDSVDRAIDTLRRAASLRRLCLWGLRAGSLLAATVAQRRGDVDILILTAPMADGARFLREQRALAAAGAPPPTGLQGVQEVAGFLYTAETITTLSALALSATPRPARSVLAQHRDDLPFDARWPEQWRSAGTAVDAQSFAGYEAMLRDAHRAEVPQPMIHAALDWIAARSPADAAPAGLSDAATGSSTDAADMAAPPQSAIPQNTVLHDTAELIPGVAREAVLQLGGEPATLAILTEPLFAATSQPLLVLLNAGSVHHIGPNRLHVELARQLAAQGVAVARVDLPGLGDAAGHADAMDNHPYPRHALDDLRRTLQALRERLRPASLHGAGICSGAYHALQLAAGEPLLDSAIIINPLTFYWREGMVVAMPDSKVVAESARYQRRILEPSAWLKLFRGRVALGTLLQILGRRMLQNLWRTLRTGAAAVGLPIRSHLDRTLAAVAAHGVTLRFLFADSDPGLAMLREQAGDTVAQLQRVRRLHIEVIADADHTFTYLRPRQQLLERIGASLRAPGPP